MFSLTEGIFRQDERFEDYYELEVKKILSRIQAYHRVGDDVLAWCRPSTKLIKWIARIGGMSEEAINAIMFCVYRGIINGGLSDNIRGEIKSDDEQKLKAYDYISSSRLRFVRNVLPVFYGCRRFVDVGGGYADKAVLAHVYGYFDTVTSIELNAFTYNASVLMLANLFPNVYYGQNRGFRKRYNINLFNMNAFDVDFGNYDAIYMYMPMQDHKAVARLHSHVINTMPTDGVLYESQTRLFGHRIKGEDWHDWHECGCGEHSSEDCKNQRATDRMSMHEWFEYCGAPLWRNIRVSHNGHVVTIRR